MATATVKAFVENAKLIVNQANNTYLALGKKTPWENENVPPVPDEETENIEEIIGYKKMKVVSLCRPLSNGEQTNYPTVKYLGGTWALIPEDKAQEEEAYHIYYSTTINPEDMSLGEYRQVGVYIGINTSKEILTPKDNEVKNRVLYFYDNRKQFNRTDQVNVTESFIINTRNTL